MTGPPVRTDIVDVYVFRRGPKHAPTGGNAAVLEFLQLLRARDPAGGTWQPIMGRIEERERAAAAAVRELGEEAGLHPRDDALLGLWALEQVRPYFVHEWNCIIMSPRFAAEVHREWSPALNDEHSAFRWIGWPEHAEEGAADPTPTSRWLVWPGQAQAIAEIAAYIADPAAVAGRLLEVHADR